MPQMAELVQQHGDLRAPSHELRLRVALAGVPPQPQADRHQVPPLLA